MIKSFTNISTLLSVAGIWMTNNASAADGGSIGEVGPFYKQITLANQKMVWCLTVGHLVVGIIKSSTQCMLLCLNNSLRGV